MMRDNLDAFIRELEAMKNPYQYCVKCGADVNRGGDYPIDVGSIAADGRPICCQCDRQAMIKEAMVIGKIQGATSRINWRRVVAWGLLIAIATFAYLIGPDLWRFRQRQIAIIECQQGDCRAWDSMARRDYR